ncbi:MAG: hypothetical protein AAB316_07290, partial [Bacteroidota bacterium]
MNAKKIFFSMGILCCLLAFSLPGMAQQGRKLYVGNLPFDTQEADLWQIFKGSAGVRFVGLPIDPGTGRTRGFGFVTMEKFEDAEKAISELNGKEWNGRILTVSVAKEQEINPSG